VLSSHSIVSSPRAVRLCNPSGGRWIGRWKTWSTDLIFCAALTNRRSGHTPFMQTGMETSDTGAEAVEPDPRCSWKDYSRGWVGVRVRGLRHPVAIHKESLLAGSTRLMWALRHQTGAQYSAVEWTRAKVALRNYCCSSSPARASKPPQECNAWCQLFAKWLQVSATRECLVQASCPRVLLLGGIWARSKRAGLRCCGWLSANI